MPRHPGGQKTRSREGAFPRGATHVPYSTRGSCNLVLRVCGILPSGCHVLRGVTHQSHPPAMFSSIAILLLAHCGLRQGRGDELSNASEESKKNTQNRQLVKNKCNDVYSHSPSTETEGCAKRSNPHASMRHGGERLVENKGEQYTTNPQHSTNGLRTNDNSTTKPQHGTNVQCLKIVGQGVGTTCLPRATGLTRSDRTPRVATSGASEKTALHQQHHVKGKRHVPNGSPLGTLGFEHTI